MQFGMAATSVRYTLIMTPAAVLIILMLLKVSDWSPTPAVLASALLLSVLLSLSIAIGDAEIANGYRQIILRRIAPSADHLRNRFYFAGHWGFHYYAEQAGGIALDTSRPQSYEPGDLVVVAQNAWPGMSITPTGFRTETGAGRLSGLSRIGLSIRSPVMEEPTSTEIALLPVKNQPCCLSQ